MSASEVLQRIITALDRAGIAYMLTGSFASAHYGAPRSILDIDIVIVANPEMDFQVRLKAGMQPC